VRTAPWPRVTAFRQRRAERQRLPQAIRLLVGVSFVVAVGYGIITPALPVFARTFDVGVTAASALAGAFAATRLAFAPVSGRLIGRVSALRLFCGGLVVVATSSGACAYATTYGQLLLFRAAGGVGSTMITISAAVLLIRMAALAARAGDGGVGHRLPARDRGRSVDRRCPDRGQLPRTVPGLRRPARAGRRRQRRGTGSASRRPYGRGPAGRRGGGVRARVAACGLPRGPSPSS
jgi:hypothetical protein